MSRPPVLRPLLSVALLLLWGLGAGCRDASGGDPLAVVLTEETRGALSLDLSLPSLPGVTARTDGTMASIGDSTASSWTGRWETSWLLEPAEGDEVRRALYDEAVPVLSRELGTEAVREILHSIGEAADAADAVARVELPASYRERVEEARTLVDRGHRALDRGAAADALRAAFEAADRMRSVSPESVAHLLLARARGGATTEAEGRSEEDQRRIGRLIRGAETALEEGDLRRAIHRAYYACRLLDVELLP